MEPLTCRAHMSSSLQPLFFSPSLISIFLSLARLRGAGSGGRTLERRCGRPRAEAVAAATQIQPTKFGLPNQAHMGAHTTGPRPITTRARSPETAQNLSLSLSVSSGQLTQPQKRHDIHPPPTATAASNAAPPHAASSFPSPLNNPTASSSKQIHGEPSLSPRPRRRRCSSSDRWSSSLHVHTISFFLFYSCFFQFLDFLIGGFIICLCSWRSRKGEAGLDRWRGKDFSSSFPLVLILEEVAAASSSSPKIGGVDFVWLLRPTAFLISWLVGLRRRCCGMPSPDAAAGDIESALDEFARADADCIAAALACGRTSFSYRRLPEPRRLRLTVRKLDDSYFGIPNRLSSFLPWNPLPLDLG